MNSNTKRRLGKTRRSQVLIDGKFHKQLRGQKVNSSILRRESGKKAYHQGCSRCGNNVICNTEQARKLAA